MYIHGVGPGTWNGAWQVRCDVITKISQAFFHDSSNPMLGNWLRQAIRICRTDLLRYCSERDNSAISSALILPVGITIPATSMQSPLLAGKGSPSDAGSKTKEFRPGMKLAMGYVATYMYTTCWVPLSSLHSHILEYMHVPRIKYVCGVCYATIDSRI